MFSAAPAGILGGGGIKTPKGQSDKACSRILDPEGPAKLELFKKSQKSHSCFRTKFSNFAICSFLGKRC